MSRPLRIEFAGALYHVTSRGDRREDIFEDDEDRGRFLSVLAECVGRFNWVVHAYCLMSNHYHLLVETVEGNLSKGMRQLNGVYTQASNRRHGRVGHLFQGRFKAILVDRDAYLLELSRYIVLNPVRARMVVQPEDWAWSSYRPTLGLAPAPAWLAADGLLKQFAEQRRTARRRYAKFVREGMGLSIWDRLRQQIYLGDDAFVEKMQRKLTDGDLYINVPRAQRRPPAPALSVIEAAHQDRDATIIAAYASGAYTYVAIAEHFGLHLATVGRIIRRGMQQ
jgi:REP element-mobilizing transposase RayT